MSRLNKTIVIVRSPIESLSSMSLESATILQSTLLTYYRDVKIVNAISKKDLLHIAALKPDIVFVGVQYIKDGSNPIWVSDFMHNYGIPCTGSQKRALNLQAKKQLAKNVVRQAGVSTADYFVADGRNQAIKGAKANNISYPLFVKPTDGGGGQGIDDNSVVTTPIELASKVDSIYKKYGKESLIEEYLDGREFSVAILRNQAAKNYSAMPLELVAPKDRHGRRILSSKVKHADTETFQPVIDKALHAKLCDIALAAFKSLDARDYGRIDIRLSSTGEPNFLEANLMPSLLKDYGNFPKAFKLHTGKSFDELILRIVNLALSRSKLHSSMSLTAI